MSYLPGEQFKEMRDAAKALILAYKERDAGALIDAAWVIERGMRRPVQDWSDDEWLDIDPLARYSWWEESGKKTPETQAI